ncbi:Lipocalin-like [Chitinophaga sp. CF118]|uniref:lipocalin family protein n=1 Tax=Chitinophaga sp. CF118 TaxID=1884367 RepID=UPI0008E3A983|nr:lipocalin family protein [Chitinophaga sp. CF118]SFD32648.1 Lipocalin-like [Chitinophaga sp. CF118]
MKKCIALATSLFILYGCEPSSRPATTIAARDSSLLDVPDSTPMQIIDSVAIMPTTDTITYSENQLLGRWLQPVAGLEKELQGFHLKKNGKAFSINTYAVIYDRWRLQHDTLLLWSYVEGEHSTDTAATIDTTIIKSLTDNTLVLFPIKAAIGYEEKYTKENTGRKGKK